MPASRRGPARGAALVALSICLLLPAGRGARADELVVMPYACTVIGGVPVLSPAPEQGYRIIGRREQRRFTACSPANPGLCRHWTVYRFDLDCDGSRVPWVSVVAAARQANRGAWLMNGRLHLRMGRRWSLAPDDPCAREPDDEDRFAYRRLRRYCADRLEMAPPPLLEMPLGFAPMLGIDAIFVAATPRFDRAPPPDREAYAERDAEPPRRPAVADAPPQRLEEAPAAREAPARLPPPASPEFAARPPSKADPGLGPATAGIPKAAGRPETAAGREEAKTAAPKPAPKAAAGPQPSTQVAKAAPADPKPALKVAAAPQAAAKEVAPEDPAPSRTTAEPEGKAITLNPLTVLRTTTTGAIVAFAGLTLGLLTAFALARRRERVRHAGQRPRDIASLSLEGRRANPAARRGPPAPPNAAVSVKRPVPGANLATGPLAQWGDRMPATRAEAFQVLGVGVTPSATEAAIKKIVDGLRMSWHPDLARDEADRRLRELRSKQINAAWDLLQGQRAEA